MQIVEMMIGDDDDVGDNDGDNVDAADNSVNNDDGDDDVDDNKTISDGGITVDFFDYQSPYF